jgi:two-component system, LuxR family, response regulator FixJ
LTPLVRRKAHLFRREPNQLPDSINEWETLANSRSGESLRGRPMRISDTHFGSRRGWEKDAQSANARATTEAIRVALVEDDKRLQQALVFQLDTIGFQVTPHSSAEEFLKATGISAFDCVVVDNFLPRMNGLQLQAALYRTVPFASIVFISGNSDLSLGMHAMRKGAVDFLEKPLDEEVLVSSIIRGANLSRKLRAEHDQRIELEGRLGELTPREHEVFALITTGRLNKQVGAELGTTERTVKAHRERVMIKMKADSLASLVRMSGILELHSTRTRSGLGGIK